MADLTTLRLLDYNARRVHLPDPDSLRCFVAGAKLLNFRAAARAVGLTPAALGQRIAQLEHQLGRPLFYRSSRQVILSEAGLAFLPAAERALDGLGDALRAGRGEAGPAPMEIFVGTRYELGLSWIVPMLPDLRRRMPHLTFNLYFGSGADLLLRVRGQEIHCAVGSMRVSDPKISSVRLHREDYVLVAERSLARKTPLRRPDDAGRHTLIDENPQLSLYAYWRDAPAAPPLAFGRMMYRGTIAAIRDAVLGGDGVAVLPKYLVAPELKAGRMVVLYPSVAPLHDYFRLYFRTDDPRRSAYDGLAAEMLRFPLR
jgi:LysR family transcriptional regulator, glycine cleavage system transcriptional activator